MASSALRLVGVLLLTVAFGHATRVDVNTVASLEPVVLLDESSLQRHNSVSQGQGTLRAADDGAVQAAGDNDGSVDTLRKCNTALGAKMTEIQLAGEYDNAGRLLEDWCLLLSDRDGGHMSASPGWKASCSKARATVEQQMLDGVKQIQSNAFCNELKEAFGDAAARRVAKAPYKMANDMMAFAPYVAPLATPASALLVYKKPRPCCRQHPEKGCHDESISECVCRKDPLCCSESWDRACAMLVEEITVVKHTIDRCGRCPAPTVQAEE